MGWGRYGCQMMGGVQQRGRRRRRRCRGWTRASVYIFCCVCLFWLTFATSLNFPWQKFSCSNLRLITSSNVAASDYICALDITSYYVFYHFCQWLCDGNWMELIYRQRGTTLSLLLWMNRDSKREEKEITARWRWVGSKINMNVEYDWLWRN